MRHRYHDKHVACLNPEQNIEMAGKRSIIDSTEQQQQQQVRFIEIASSLAPREIISRDIVFVIYAADLSLSRGLPLLLLLLMLHAHA